ncbi:MAG: nucleotidyltransferase domain-containing protein [Elusimicrobia bacterium]|nr:nucleotidyltransferase domain-containing protein [Elusimicrobiota bacterium]
MTFNFQKDQMEKLGIAGIFLFGSQANGIANNVSDFDFAVLVKNKEALYNNVEKIKFTTSFTMFFPAR